MTVTDDIDLAGTAALGLIEGVTSLDELKTIEPELFGKKSALGQFKRALGQLDPDDRRSVGQHLNTTREAVSEALGAKRVELGAVERRIKLEAERMDLTESTETQVLGHLHPVTQTMQRLEDVFVGMGFTVSEGPEVETDWYNFEALNLPKWHPARSR